MTENQSRLPCHTRLVEPALAFHPDRHGERHVHPLKGLLKFGPFSRATLAAVLDPIRIGIIAPQGASGRVVNLLQELERSHVPRERRQYLPAFPGMSAVFRTRVAVEPAAIYEVPDDVARRVVSDRNPHYILAEHILATMAAIRRDRCQVDVVMIYLPDRWSQAFENEDDDFDLHDFIKAHAALEGIPTQLLRDGINHALDYHCRCSVAWRLSIALYTKAGGVPWKMANALPDVAYLGISYALKRAKAGPQFVTCCSQVFDADGAGLEFVAYETDDVSIVRRNPYLSRAEMRRLMARSVALYQRRHVGRLPKRVVIHKTTPFRDDEVEACLDAWSSVDEIDLLQVQGDSAWRGIDLEKKAQAAAYPCDRGIVQVLGGAEFLLWTQGNVQEAADGRDYFKEGKGIPAPLLVRRFAGHGGFVDDATSILALSKMNWNNDGLYDRLPVTLAFAGRLANIVKRMPTLTSRPYEVRFFM